MTPPAYAPVVVLAPLPTTISPSRIATFTDCPRMFQYQAIERLEQPPTVWTLKGTLVHAALESLFWRDPAERTLEAALAALDEATTLDEIVEGYDVLGLDDGARAEFSADAATLVRNYFDLEDPRVVDAVGVELRVATSLAGASDGAPLELRGIIDRLDREDDGRLVVVDYKTGRAPGPGFERAKMAGVETYALLCERVLGVRPTTVRLLYLREPVIVERAIGSPEVSRQERRTVAVWNAITKAHAKGGFQPSPGPLCRFCAYSDRCEAAQLPAVAAASAP